MSRDLEVYLARLRRLVAPGQTFERGTLHRAVWPKHPVANWIGVHRDELDRIANALANAGAIVPAIGPRGGHCWRLGG